MSRQSRVLAAFAVAAAVVAGTPVQAQQRQHRNEPGSMMGMGMGMMHMRHDSATRAQMQVIHEMVMNHEKITRTVTQLPNGIHTVTESDDPRLADLIREHVLNMESRVKAGDDPGLPMESPALKALFRVQDRIHTAIEATPKGIAVRQISSDPAVVALLQQHAAEVSDLVTRGPAAMHEAMMKHGGGMMGRGMMGPGMGRGMMRPAPDTLSRKP